MRLTKSRALQNSKTLIVIAGSTAVGKTDVAIAVAKHFQTQIISADSRQCYRQLTIGSAKPSAAQLAETEHFFINSHDISENVSAADFEEYALAACSKIFLTNNVAVVCGGTGLYIKALCSGLDDIQAIDPAVKQTLREQYELGGIDWLKKTLEHEDSFFFEHGEIQNPHRMLRALEVKRSSGKSILSHHTGTKKNRGFAIKKFCLELPREILHERINARTDEMMKSGLEEEARSLYPFRELKALQTPGYAEMFQYFENQISLPACAELIKQHTRQYAKRQMTWFARDGEMVRIAPSAGEILQRDVISL